MARVLLILPHLPQKMGSPYLGQQYVASSLLADGHEVRCLDLAAIRSTKDSSSAVSEAEAFGPDMIGMTLFTYNALAGYQLAKQLRGTTRLLVAGGAHPTVDPTEPLRYGFDVGVYGEGELVTVALARHLGCAAAAVQGERDLARILASDLCFWDRHAEPNRADPASSDRESLLKAKAAVVCAAGVVAGQAAVRNRRGGSAVPRGGGRQRSPADVGGVGRDVGR